MLVLAHLPPAGLLHRALFSCSLPFSSCSVLPVALPTACFTSATASLAMPSQVFVVLEKTGRIGLRGIAVLGVASTACAEKA